MNEKLSKHALLVLLLDRLKPTLDRASKSLEVHFKKHGKLRLDDPPPMSAVEQYDYSVFHRLANILSVIERLYETKTHMLWFPEAKRYERKNISRDQWFNYHFAVYVVAQVSFLDLSLLLTNAAFRLGIPEKLCSLELIRQNEWVRTTSVAKALNSLETTVKPFKGHRNRHLHRGHKPDLPAIMGSEDFDLLQMLTFVTHHDRKSFPRTLLIRSWREQTKIIGNRLDAEIAAVEAAIANILDSLYPIYMSQVARIATHKPAGTSALPNA